MDVIIIIYVIPSLARPATAAERSHPIPISKLKTVGNIKKNTTKLYNIVYSYYYRHVSLWPSINNNILFVVNHALCYNNVVQIKLVIASIRCIRTVKAYKYKCIIMSLLYACRGSIASKREYTITLIIMYHYSLIWFRITAVRTVLNIIYVSIDEIHLNTRI